MAVLYYITVITTHNKLQLYNFPALLILGVIVYDPIKNEWNAVNTVLPKARLGSCAVVDNDTIILIGGKGHLEDLTGSDEIWEFDPHQIEWKHNDIDVFAMFWRCSW